jgi:general secretion pathway protein L
MGDELSWFDSAGGAVVDATAGDAERLLAVPAEQVLLREVPFTPAERRLLKQTVPYALEEQLLDEVDNSHFALGPVEEGRVAVAVVRRDWLANWLERCAALGLDIQRVVPEQLLLPWQPEQWSLRATRERWLVRYGRWRGFALEPTSAALALQLLLDEGEAVPRQLLVDSDIAFEELLPQLPELLRGVAVAQPLRSDGAVATDWIDLRQGIFARALPWRRWWWQWRWPAGVVGAAVAVQFAVAGLEHYQLKQRHLQLRQQIEAVYRSVEPQGYAPEPERQLQRKVQALRGVGGAALMPLLEKIGAAVHAIDGVALQSLTYSERQSEVRLSFSAASFADVEKLRQAIAAKGLDAQLVGSSADGSRTRAQMRVKALR